MVKTAPPPDPARQRCEPKGDESPDHRQGAGSAAGWPLRSSRTRLDRACLPTLVSKAPTGPEWVHEIKWDGYRVSAYIDHGQVTIRTRRGHDWTDRFPAIAQALGALPIHSAVIDGEAVVSGRARAVGLRGLAGCTRA